MAFCIECGNRLPDVAKFCPECGTKVAAAETPAPAAPPEAAPEAPPAETTAPLPPNWKAGGYVERLNLHYGDVDIVSARAERDDEQFLRHGY